MVRIRLYIEGGGSGNRLDHVFRRAWADFFKSAGLGGRLPSIVRGGSRNQTYARFVAAVKNANPNDMLILLVDSEGPISPQHSSWQHLQVNDRWTRPPGVGEGAAFLMTQVMETWLLADRDALRNYFGASFRANRLPQHRDLESIPKDTVLQSLEQATADCNRKYQKGIVSFEILQRINPDLVSASCPQSKALLDHLRSL